MHAEAPRSRHTPPVTFAIGPPPVFRVEIGDQLSYDGNAIVNAANERCLGDDGLDAAITSAGGQKMAAERSALRIQKKPDVRCPTGSAVVTSAGNGSLKTKYMIHAVGPVFTAGVPRMSPVNLRARQQVESAVESSLNLAAGMGMKRVAFPFLSGGVFANGQEFDAASGILKGMHRMLKYEEESHDDFVMSEHGALAGRFHEVVLYVRTQHELEFFHQAWIKLNP